ncbi:MAG: CPBP family intramembrane metalloprotease [Candidatus Roizmanbacteria bacterium]|nr:MAG: CPBP family intramembrane metalloprotease [Candidatus Roizmanbacteria bacterium]
MVQKLTPLHKALNLWAVILIIWSVYRAYFRTDLPIWIDEFIAKPLVFILPIYIYISRFEKKNFFEDIGLKLNNLVSNIVLGVGIGLVFFISGGLGLILKSKDVFSVFNNLGFYSIIFFFTISLVTSISEEVLSRGFVLKRMYEDSKNMFTAIFLSSILFFFLHVPILFASDKMTGFLLLRVMFSDLILSLAVSFIYLEKRNLTLPIAIHSFYNLSLYFFL